MALNITTSAETQSGVSALGFPLKKSHLRINAIIINARHTISNFCQDAVAIGVTLSVFQILDGWLTSIGIYRYGLEIEANPFLRMLMCQYGHVQVLTIIKLLAIVTILFLTISSSKVKWLKSALATLGAFYLFFAIIPWVFILLLHPVIS